MKPFIALPVTAYLIYRSYTRQSLTGVGILAATLTALIHAAHPSALPFSLLVVFFVAGNSATKVKYDLKASLTLSSTGRSSSASSPLSSSSLSKEGGERRRGGGGGGGGQGRTHIQVVSNSGVASLLVLLHLWRVTGPDGGKGGCIPTTGSRSGLILAGIVANYAAVAADTFSSELGILAARPPRLITRPWVEVPRGTNGGVTATGIGAGIAGALIVAVASVLLMPFCGGGGPADGLGPVGRVLMFGEKEELFRGWTMADKLIWVLVVTCWGALGSVLDSLLGALLQASVVDRRTGKIVEGTGGEKVLVTAAQGKDAKRKVLHPQTNGDEATTMATTTTTTTLKSKYADTDQKLGAHITPPAAEEQSRRVLVGRDWLDNNQVNLLMAASMSFGAMLVASWYWAIPLSTIWTK